MNAERLSLFQNVLIQTLGSAILEHYPKDMKFECTEQNVFENLKYIYEEIEELEFGEPTGRKIRFMPKKYKEMVMRLISPECSITRRITTSEYGVTAEAFLYLDRLDEKPVSFGKATVVYSNLNLENVTEYEARSTAELTAIGQAESKALQRFGIGSWYSYRLEPESNPDLLLDTAKKNSELNPTIAISSTTVNVSPEQQVEDVAPALQTETPKEKSKSEKAVIEKNTAEKETKSDSKKTSRKAAKEQTESDEPVQSELDLAVPEDNTHSEAVNDDAVNSESTTIAESVMDSSLSLDDARKLVSDTGKAAGQELGKIEKEFGGHMTWLYTHSQDEKVKNGCKVIILNNPELLEYSKNLGVII